MNDLARRIVDEMLGRAGLYRWDSAELAGVVSAPVKAVAGELWALWGLGKIERTLSGRWYIPHESRPALTGRLELTEAQQRLLKAIRRSRSCVSLTELAARAEIARPQLRAVIDEMVRIGALIETAAGWYKIPTAYKGEAL